MADDVILPFSAAAKMHARNANMLRKTWLRAGLPVYPTVVVDKRGNPRTVQGICKNMLEAFLLAGGCPRRVSSAQLGAEVRRRFRIDD